MINNYSCAICKGKTALWRIKNNYYIYKCNNCGHGQVLPVLSIDEIRHIYAVSGHDSSNVEREEITLQTLLEKEKTYPNSTLDAERFVTNALTFGSQTKYSLLDIGAGYGFFTRAFLNAGFEVDAIENAKQESKVFQDLNGFLPYQCLFEDFNPSTRYSHILMSQILEHVIDPNAWIKKSFSLLEEDGLLIIALPNFNSLFRKVMQEKEPYIIPPYHLNYFTPQSLKALLISNNFKILRVETVSRLPINRVLKNKGFPSSLLPFASICSSIVLKTIDLFKHGSMLHIYAYKSK